MKLLLCSDLHDEEAALESLSKLSKLYDYTLVCGDICSSNYFLQSAFENILNSYFIPGNSESKELNDILLESPQCLHGRQVEIKNGFNIVGFGYSSPTPYGTYGELSEEEISSQLSKLKIDSKTILMLHCPPFGYFDINKKGKNIGSTSILSMIEQRRPYLACFGHAHNRIGVGQLGETKIIKIPPANEMSAVSLDIDDDGFLAEFISL